MVPGGQHLGCAESSIQPVFASKPSLGGFPASKRNRPGRSRPGRLPIQVMALGHLSQRLMTMLSGPRDKMASAGSS